MQLCVAWADVGRQDRQVSNQNSVKGVSGMQGWEEVDGRALQVCAACNLAWLDTSFQLAPEANLESGNTFIHDDCSAWQSGLHGVKANIDSLHGGHKA